ncbi:MAG: 30S ribosome-binding factor RbfA [Dehalococcoidia bacterium]|nr:30S ribosome-binding factor RbfA [Dehalococcoidia bacterium]
MTRRTERLNEALRAEISEILKREVKDPRLSSFVTITEVICSKDLRHAKVYVSIMGSEQEKKEVLDGLRSAAGFLRRSLFDRIKIRYIPELSFENDTSIEHGSHLLDLMRQIRSDTTPKASNTDSQATQDK